jgi:hypothetical protein
MWYGLFHQGACSSFPRWTIKKSFIFVFLHSIFRQHLSIILRCVLTSAIEKKIMLAADFFLNLPLLLDLTICMHVTLKGPCHDINLGFMTKARACKGAGWEWSPRITFYAPKSVGECEGMNPHTPKWASTLWVGVSMDSWIFKEQF